MPAGTPQQYLDSALDALDKDADWRTALDSLPVPVYRTDAEGAVTYWNRACVDFAGREPKIGSDRWCVTWQLYSTGGDPMPHEDCPMAEAVRTKQEVRGKVAIALRPDGRRRAFAAYPTPLFDKDGDLTGAINMLIDVSDEQADELTDQSARCRRLARSTNDQSTAEILGDMAKSYAEIADTLRDRR